MASTRSRSFKRSNTSSWKPPRDLRRVLSEQKSRQQAASNAGTLETTASCTCSSNQLRCFDQLLSLYPRQRVVSREKPGGNRYAVWELRACQVLALNVVLFWTRSGQLELSMLILRTRRHPSDFGDVLTWHVRALTWNSGNEPQESGCQDTGSSSHDFVADARRSQPVEVVLFKFHDAFIVSCNVGFRCSRLQQPYHNESIVAYVVRQSCQD